MNFFVLICKRKDVTILNEVCVCCCVCCSEMRVEAWVSISLCPPAHYSNDISTLGATRVVRKCMCIPATVSLKSQ